MLIRGNYVLTFIDKTNVQGGTGRGTSAPGVMSLITAPADKTEQFELVKVIRKGNIKITMNTENYSNNHLL